MDHGGHHLSGNFDLLWNFLETEFTKIEWFAIFVGVSIDNQFP